MFFKPHKDRTLYFVNISRSIFAFNIRICKIIKTFPIKEIYSCARLLKYISLIIRFALSGRAHWIFVEHFSLFPRLAFHAICPLFFLYIYTHTNILYPVSSSLLLPFSRPQKYSGYPQF